MTPADKTALAAAPTPTSVADGDADTLAAAKTDATAKDDAVKTWASTQDGAVALAAENRDVALAYSLRKPLDGAKWLTVGDSISTLNISSFAGQHYRVLVPAMSGGRIFFKYGTGVSGHTSAQQKATLTTHLNSTSDYTMATVMLGTNDLSQGIAMSTWQANIQAIVTLLRSKNIEPVLFTIPPRSGPTNPVGASTIQDQWNAWLKTYCAAQGLTYVDIWGAVADPATREWRTGFVSSADGVHPTPQGMAAMSDEIWRTLAPRLVRDPYGKAYCVPASSQPYATSLMTLTSAALPTGWTKPGSNTTVTYVADGQAPGGYAADQYINSSAGSSAQQLYTSGSGVTSGFAAGDVLRAVISARVLRARNIAAGHGMKLLVRAWTSESAYTDDDLQLYGLQCQSDEYLNYAAEWTVPAGVIGYTFYWQNTNNGSGQLHTRLGGFGLYNLTNLGVA